jgi:hypothetical protein
MAAMGLLRRRRKPEPEYPPSVPALLAPPPPGPVRVEIIPLQAKGTGTRQASSSGPTVDRDPVTGRWVKRERM